MTSAVSLVDVDSGLDPYILLLGREHGWVQTGTTAAREPFVPYLPVGKAVKRARQRVSPHNGHG